MRAIVVFVLCLSYVLVSTAQTCLPGGITFTSQAQINAFPANYPGCHDIQGGVTIDETVNGEILNVDSLQQLNNISGEFRISNNTLLSNLDGLQNLTIVGGSLQIRDNPSLANIEGLGNISAIGYAIIIDNNDLLVNLEGFPAASLIPGFLNIDNNDGLLTLAGMESLSVVGESMTLNNNSALTSLSGLESLEAIRGYGFIINSPVTSLSGLIELDSVYGQFTIANTSMLNLSGMNSLHHIGSLTINNNAVLINAGTGFLSLDSIGGNVWITSNPSIENFVGYDSIRHIGGNVIISTNSSLMDFSGLEKLIDINGDVNIAGNQMLNSFSGLDGLQNIEGSITVQQLEIGNAILPDFTGLDMLAHIGGTFHIENAHELTSLNGLGSLEHIDGDLIIVNLNDLVSLDGLSSLDVIGGVLRIWNSYLLIDMNIPDLDTLGMGFDINGNQNLSFIGRFDSLKYIGGNVLINNQFAIDSICGFATLNTIDGNFDISNNYNLKKISGFDVLETIDGRFKVYNNAGLSKIDAFQTLQSVNGNFELTSTSVTDVLNFSSLESINGTLTINSNPRLKSLSGLENIEPSYISHLYLTNCDSLSLCSIGNICTFLTNAGPNTIYSNDPGCNNLAEVQFLCNPVLSTCTNLTTPLNNAIDVPIDQNFTWNPSPPITLGYILDVGTTLGGSEILDSIVLTNTNYYDPVANLPPLTKVYFRITPYNIVGVTTGCPSDSFYTVSQLTWVGGNGDWNVPSNWDIGMVPVDSSKVVIESGTVTIPESYNAVAGRVLLKGTGQLLIRQTASLDINAGGPNSILDLSATSLLSNDGTIRIGNNRAIESTAIHLSVDATLENDTNGIIQINHLTTYQQNAIFVEGGSADVLNSGLIQIGNSVSINGHGIKLINGGLLTNTTTGEITIDNITGSNNDAINMEGNGRVINAGEIRIGSVATINRYGINIVNFSILENQSSGFIFIDMVQTGIKAQNVNQPIENDGEIRIGELGGITSRAIWLTLNSQIVNDSTGVMYIDQAQDGILLETSAKLWNYGVVKIGTLHTISTNGLQIITDGDFYNQAGGVVEINKTYQAITMTGSGSWFQNFGILKIGNSGTSNYGIYLSTSAYLYVDAAAYLEINSIITEHAIKIQSNSTINNFGNVQIGNISNINVNGISMVSGGDFRNYSGAVLEVNRCLNLGISLLNTGSTLENYATIRIGNVAAVTNVGVDNSTSAVVTNYVGGLITINRTTGYAAITTNNSATLNNSGTIRAGDLENINGGIIIYASGKFNNLAGGVFEVNRTSWVGALIDQSGALITNNGSIKIGNLTVTSAGISLTNGGDFVNTTTGTIEIDRMSDFGILSGNSGSVFTNNGNITIGTNGTIGSHSINTNSSATFNNTSTGNIKVNNTNVNWWSKAIVVTSASFTNTGTIIMGDLFQNFGGISVESAGTFTNAAGAFIYAHKTIDNGIQLTNTNTTFTNNGNIRIGVLGELGTYGIYVGSSALFTNSSSGSIEINNVITHWWATGIILESAGKFNNSGIINLGNLMNNNSSLFIKEAGVFTNLSGASFNINNSLHLGVDLAQSGSAFVNHGNLKIGSIGNVKEMGIKLSDNATLTNSGTGVIYVNRLNAYWWSRAISIAHSTLTNSGNIQLGNEGLNSVGFYLEDLASFTNNVSGMTGIDNVTDYGMQILQTGTTCTNYGNLSIGTSMGIGQFGIIIADNSSMTNAASGVMAMNKGNNLNTSGGIFVHKGSFTNAGMIRAGNVSNVGFGIRLGNSASETGTFNNQGTIEIDRITNTYYAAIALIPNSIFTNQSTGLIKLGFNGNVTYGIYGGGTFSNYGNIQAKDVTYGTVDYGQTVTNYSGAIMESFSPGTLVIESNGTLNNQAGAILRSLPGGFIRVKGRLNNYGFVEAQ